MPRSVEYMRLSHGAPGTARQLKVWRFGTLGARPKVYVQGGLHADETPGVFAAHRLIRLLEGAQIRGEIVVVPVANPIGLDQRILGMPLGRFETSGGENFNRNYPDLTDAALDLTEGRLGDDAETNGRLIREALRTAAQRLQPRTELESQRFALLSLAVDADIVLDLHCDDQALVHLYLGSPLWPDASDLAAETGARVALLAEESGGHPFDEACSSVWWKLRARLGDRHPLPAGCLAATVELRGEADVSDALAAQDAEALFRFLQRRGAVAGDPGPPPTRLCEATPLDGMDILRAPTAGIVAYKKTLGDMVEPGDVVAEIVDPLAEGANGRAPVAARTKGVMFTATARRGVCAQDVVAKIAGAESLPDRKGALLTA